MGRNHAKVTSQCINFVKNNNSFGGDRKSTRLNSSHVASSYAVFCLKKKIEISTSAIQSNANERFISNQLLAHQTSKIHHISSDLLSKKTILTNYLLIPKC